MNMRILVVASFLLLVSDVLAAQSCDQTAGIHFSERALASGVRFEHRAHHTTMSYPLEVMGSGVALLDYDNDGRLDIFFANGAAFPVPNSARQAPRKEGPGDWNRLYHQKEDGSFEDVTEKAGLQGEDYGMGVAVGDYDNDGNEDIFVAGFPRNHLYHNNGNGTFTDVTVSAGIHEQGWSTSAAWVDLDQDGRLDLVVLRYLDWNFDDRSCPTPDGKLSYCDPAIFPAIRPLVYHNDGGGHFTEEAVKIGMGRAGKGLGIAIGDYDRDGQVDIFVANDGMDEFLYRNRGHGNVEEAGLSANVATDENGRNYAGMGVVFQDLNGDGLPDLLIDDLALQSFAFYRNRGDGSFDYRTPSSGLGRLTMAHSGWGIAAIDAANVGALDLVAARGHVNVDIQKDNPQLNYLEPPVLLHPTERGYVDISACLGDVTKQSFAGRGLAIGDLDNDGRIDVVMTANDGRAYLLHNESSAESHWLTLKLTGTTSNRDGIGAEVYLKSDHHAQWGMVSTSGSYESSSDRRVHFGLGADHGAQTVVVRWPSGRVEEITLGQVDRQYTLTEGKGITEMRCGQAACANVESSAAPKR